MSDDTVSCFKKQMRDYLVAITVHKARNLRVLNADTFVVVNFNGGTKKTKVYQNSDCPFFNEYFTFEHHTSLENLLKKNICITVMEDTNFPRVNQLIGEINISVEAVWAQEGHLLIKKWGILEQFGDGKEIIAAGYLQVDVAIVSVAEPAVTAPLQTFDDDFIGENLLLPIDTKDNPETVKYAINIFEGTFVVEGNYSIQVSLGSQQTRTRHVDKSKTCRWNEQVVFYGMFPSLNQLLIFELLTEEILQWKVKTSVEISFDDLSWSIDGHYCKPAFGPCYLHFYKGTHKDIYFGKISISIETQSIDDSIPRVQLTRKRDILTPFYEADCWDVTMFKVKMVLVNMDAMKIHQNHLTANITCEDVTSNTIDVNLKRYEKQPKLKFAQFDSNVRPLMSLSVMLPDNRLKLQMINLFQLLITEMNSNAKNFRLFEARYQDNAVYLQNCIKMFMSDLKSRLEEIETKLVSIVYNHATQWDKSFIKFLQFTVSEFLKKIEKSLPNGSLQEYKSFRDLLARAINIVELDPFVSLNITTSDGKLLAVQHFELQKYVHSQSSDCREDNCGKLHSLIIKPTTCIHSCDHCGCLFGKADIFLWIGSDNDMTEWLPQNTKEITPNQIEFTAERFYKCNAFVHQAKILSGMNKTGSCNAQLVITANGLIEASKISSMALAPLWNEVLVIENVKTFNIAEDRQADYILIVMLLCDDDKRKLSLTGTGIVEVPVKMNVNQAKIHTTKQLDIRQTFQQIVHQSPPRLRWLKLCQNGTLSAEVLLSVELVELTAPMTVHERAITNDLIPSEIRPTLRKFRLEAIFVGIRQRSKLKAPTAGRYKIELTLGDLKIESGYSGIAHKSNLNFLDPSAAGFALLPNQLSFWPSIVIKYLDCSHKTPIMLGVTTIQRADKFYKDLTKKKAPELKINRKALKSKVFGVLKLDEAFDIEQQPLLEATNENANLLLKGVSVQFKFPKFLESFTKSSLDQNKRDCLESKYTWWCKFYNSNREQRFRNDKLQQLTIYPNELEKQTCFEYLNDWAFPVDLIKGKEAAQKKGKHASLKLSIAITKFNEGENVLQSSMRLKRSLLLEKPIVVQVYIVQGQNLRSKDLFGYSDAYIKVQLGAQEISDRSHYIPNEFSPVFGKSFQLSGSLPQDTQLKISVYDRDTLSRDDLIGFTKIDLEDRVQSKYCANCGIPREFNSTGYNAWRNALLPSEILSSICNELELPQPQYFPDHIFVAGIRFKDSNAVSKDSNTKERLAISVLNNFHRLPTVGYSLVPEHVETRSLYRDDRPGVEQGKLQMWVEVLDLGRVLPDLVDITPIAAQPYVLRVIVWNVKDVILDEKNIFGDRMSDIYVKCWIGDISKAQCTDIHYRSLNGEGSFNWRMIFDLKYSIGDDMMVVVKKKSRFEKFDKLMKLPAVLNIQVWDSDSFSRDDFLGTVTVNLSHFPQPFSSPANCLIGKNNQIYENLFAAGKSIKGWIPAHGKPVVGGAIKQTGKIEIELELLSDEDAQSSPVGLGRDEPSSLPPPNRGNTSFYWIKNPVRSMKYILWPHFRKCGLVVIAAIILTIVIGLAILNFPKLLSKAVKAI